MAHLSETDPELWKQRVAAVLQEREVMIQRHGHMIQHVFGDEHQASLSYTIGLHQQGWPEVAVLCLQPETAHIILNDLVAQCKERGRAPEAGELLTELANLPLAVVAMGEEYHAEYIAGAVNRAEALGAPAPTAVQLVLCDRAGKMPWDPGYDHAYMTGQKCLAPGGVWPEQESES